MRRACAIYIFHNSLSTHCLVMLLRLHGVYPVHHGAISQACSFRAEEMFRNAITLEPHGRSYEQLGKVLIMQERPKEALQEYQEALKMMPDNAEILCQIGLLRLRQGTDKAQRIGMSHPCTVLQSLWLLWNCTWCCTGDNSAAMESLVTATALQPKHPKATLALGSVMQDNLDLDGALQQYRVAVHVHPTVPQVHHAHVPV
jgi:tetratricopeptide (TPR) repeat protein